MITDRQTLGEVMQHWHRSGGDPVYAVGSYLFSGMDYPDPEVVERARDSLARDLHKPHASWGIADVAELEEIVDALDRLIAGTF